MTLPEHESPRAAGRRSEGRSDWSSWPKYEAAALGLRGSWWYPVMWSSQVRKKAVGVELLGRKVVFFRDAGTVYALNDRCPHRGVPLSLGSQQFPGTLTCAYHGWTYDLETGVLRAVITDGPDSPICGKVSVETFPVAERLGMVWIFLGDGRGRAPPVDVAIPKELREHSFSMGGRIDIRRGGWRYAAENGFDEGHAKYLHRTSLWRMFKVMPTWTKTRVIPTDEGWITRVQDEVHWSADFPWLGRWTNERWWRRGAKMLGASPSKAPNADKTIAVARTSRAISTSGCQVCCGSCTRSSSITSGTSPLTRTVIGTCSSSSSSRPVSGPCWPSSST